MFDLYFVESPLQLLSAIEAKRIFAHKSILIVNISNITISDNQIMALLKDDEWFKIHILKRSKNRRWNTLLTISRTILLYFKYQSKIRNYCYGEFRNIDMTALGVALKPEKLILLDDGTFTITAQNHYIKNNKTAFNVNTITPFIYSNFFKIDLKVALVPDLFSFFDFKDSLLDGQTNYFQKQQKKKIKLDLNKVYYFGSKSSEAGHLALDTELMILRFVIKRYNQYKIQYIPHRGESSSKLELIKQLGYTVEPLGCPAELFFDETEVMPHTIISCYSTTLYSCFSRFSNVNIISIDILTHIIDSDARINAECIYSYYKDIGMYIENMEYESDC
jgi:hypothetical protein